jgi:hypothetical protein
LIRSYYFSARPKLWALTKPDYTNERATPVINFSGVGQYQGSWTADQNGHVRIHTEGTNAIAGAWMVQMATVNGRTVRYNQVFPNSVGWGIPLIELYPVSKGNTFILYHNGSGWDSIVSNGYFIPDRSTVA